MEKENILNYIKENFNIDKTSYLLISEIYDYFYNSYNYLGQEHYMNILIEILNNADIDLSIEELKENKII